MRVVVTGADGLVGQALCACFRVAGDEVLGLGRGASGVRRGVAQVGCDIRDAAGVEAAFAAARPGVVIHAAACADVDACEGDPGMAQAVNADGTRHVSQAAARHGARLVYLSTDYVFDGEKGAPYDEEDLPNPVNVYGRSKLAGEEHVRAGTGRALVIRTSWVFGPGRANFAGRMVAQAQAGETVTVIGDQRGSPTYSRDLAAAVHRLVMAQADRVPAATVHVANTGVCSREEFARELLRRVRRGGAMVEVVGDAGAARRPPATPLATGRYATVAGGPLRPWQEAVGAFVADHVA